MAFSCGSCDKTFTARYLLNRHLVTHTRVRNHLCPICGEAFLQSSALNRHAASHEARLAYRCEECGKRFNRSSTRDVHQASHSEKKYVCNRCGKAFHQKSTLKTHELIHTGTRPLQCSYCEKTFRQRSNLQVHISRWHRGVTGTLRNEDSGFSRKKKPNLLSNYKLQPDIRRDNCTKGRKHRCPKEAYPFHSETSQVCDVDIVDKNNEVDCAPVKCDLNNVNKNEAMISDLLKGLSSNNSRKMFTNSSKYCRNSTISATENKCSSDSDVDVECETEEYSSPSHRTSARFKSGNSEVHLIVEEVSDTEHPLRPAVWIIPCCKYNNKRSSGFPDREASSRSKNAETRPTEKPPDAQKVASGSSSTSDNNSKVEVMSKSTTMMVFDHLFPSRKHPVTIQPLVGAVNTKLVEANNVARDHERIPTVSDAFPISLSTLPHSNINVQANPWPVDTSPLRIHTNPLPVDTNPLPVDTNPLPLDANHLPVHTNPVRAHTNPLHVNTNPLPVGTHPNRVHTHPLPVHTNLLHVHTNPLHVHTNPLHVHTNPLPIDTNPLHVHTNPSSAHTNSLPVHTNHLPVHTNPLPIDTNPLHVHTNPSSAHTNSLPVDTNPLPIDTNPLCVDINPSCVHTNASSPKEPEWEDHSSNVLPNVENFLANVFKSCRLATSLMNPVASSEQITTVPPRQKLAPRRKSRDFFSGSKAPGERHLRVEGSISRKPDKLMYVKLFTPEKPVTEFIWSCGV